MSVGARLATRTVPSLTAWSGARTSLLVAGLCLGLASCGGTGERRVEPPQTGFGVVRVDESHDGRPLQLAAGEVLEVRLRAYAAQGFAIRLGSVVTPTLVQDGTPRYVDDETQRIGGGTFGYEIWRFRAARPGEVRLRLDFRRQWETTGPPTRSVVYDVTVR